MFLYLKICSLQQQLPFLKKNSYSNSSYCPMSVCSNIQNTSFVNSEKWFAIKIDSSKNNTLAKSQVWLTSSNICVCSSLLLDVFFYFLCSSPLLFLFWIWSFCALVLLSTGHLMINFAFSYTNCSKILASSSCATPEV